MYLSFVLMSHWTLELKVLCMDLQEMDLVMVVVMASVMFNVY